MNLNKYKYIRYSKDDLVNNQIKALLLKFEFEVNKLNLDIDLQINLINEWVETFEVSENYEYLSVFRKRKSLLYIKKYDTNYSIQDEEYKLYKASLKERIFIFIKNIFKKA